MPSIDDIKSLMTDAIGVPCAAQQNEQWQTDRSETLFVVSPHDINSCGIVELRSGQSVRLELTLSNDMAMDVIGVLTGRLKAMPPFMAKEPEPSVREIVEETLSDSIGDDSEEDETDRAAV